MFEDKRKPVNIYKDGSATVKAQRNFPAVTEIPGKVKGIAGTMAKANPNMVKAGKAALTGAFAPAIQGIKPALKIAGTLGGARQKQNAFLENKGIREGKPAGNLQAATIPANKLLREPKMMSSHSAETSQQPTNPPGIMGYAKNREANEALYGEEGRVVGGTGFKTTPGKSIADHYQDSMNLTNSSPKSATTIGEAMNSGELNPATVKPKDYSLAAGTGWMKNEDTGEFFYIGKNNKMYDGQGQVVNERKPLREAVEPQRGHELKYNKPGGEHYSSLNVQFDDDVSPEARRSFLSRPTPEITQKMTDEYNNRAHKKKLQGSMQASLASANAEKVLNNKRMGDLSLYTKESNPDMSPRERTAYNKQLIANQQANRNNEANLEATDKRTFTQREINNRNAQTRKAIADQEAALKGKDLDSQKRYRDSQIEQNEFGLEQEREFDSLIEQYIAAEPGSAEKKSLREKIGLLDPRLAEKKQKPQYHKLKSEDALGNSSEQLYRIGEDGQPIPVEMPKYPSPPREVRDRVKDKVYQGVNGPVIWDGKGFKNYTSKG